MKTEMARILRAIPGYEERILDLKETLIANLVMISEIPAPTFKEHERRDFIIERFNQGGLQNCSTDEIGNALGILPGEEGDRNILIVAHLDTVFNNKVDHTVTVHPDQVIGPGVADNAMGVSALVTLPIVLEHLNIRLKSNLILMGTARSLGRGDIAGLRFFLSNSDIPISMGLCIEGVKLGRLSYYSIGMMRCEISCQVPEQYDWTRFGAVGSVVTLNKVINRILGIPLPRRPRTNIVLGMIEGGTSFDTVATRADLKFEIRSESAKLVRQVGQQIESIAEEVAALTEAEVNYKVFAQRKPGGIKFSHPLASNARTIIKQLGIKPWISPSTSELAAFIAHRIPAITLGLTDGANLGKPDETIEIAPISKGIAQLAGLILAIDRGCCDEHK